MSIAEIEKTKYELKEWIQNLADIDMLHALETLKATEEENSDWESLPEAHRHNIMEGLKQAENGEGVSSEEFWRILKNG